MCAVNSIAVPPDQTALRQARVIPRLVWRGKGAGL